MRCTKHVFDLKVLLFIFLVESDPNFCGSGLAVAVLGCSASLSTLQTCRQCLTLVFITQGRFFLWVPSPCRGVSLQTNQLSNGWFNYFSKRSLKPFSKCKGPNKLIKFLLWMGIEYCTLQSSNIIKQSNMTTCLAQRAQHTRLCPEHRPSVQIPTRLPAPATETNPE